MPYVNEKLLRLILVLVGLATLGGFGWKMYDYVQNQDTIISKVSIANCKFSLAASPFDAVLTSTHPRR